MGDEAVSTLMRAHNAAEENHLSGILDAYEIVCAYGYLPESWQTLATQLAIYLDAEYFHKSMTKPPLTFRSNTPLETYFVPLHDAEVAYLASDAITALFHARAVIAPWQHLECDVKTSYIDVVTWRRVQVSQRQMVVRRCLITLKHDDLHLLLDGIRREIVDRDYLNGLRQSSSTTDAWSPCSASHIEILPRLELEMSDPDARFLGHAVDYQPPTIDPPPSLAATLLQRATSRATSFLGSPRRRQDTDGQLSSLEPIMEDRPASMFTRSVLDADGRSKRDTKRSSFSDYRSFVTALTYRTGSSAHRSFATGKSRRSLTTTGTAEKRSTIQTFMSLPTTGTNADDMANLSQWSETLKQKDIIPDPELENWSSGRGQHAEYWSHERDLIPLTVESVLGQTTTALVESVNCMRVRLVRKIIRCNRRTRLKREDALQEVQQLYRAQHSHVVRLVGTYIIDDELAILTYPCAEWNLEQFLSIIPTAVVLVERTKALSKFFTCLAKTLDFIHSFPIKHMDIKPQNILVRNIRHTSINGDDPFKIYLTDFGSSRFYPSVEDTETDSWTPFTRAYAAQEVILQERRGLSADIFSMGCVYAEMLAIILDGLTDRSSASVETHWDNLTRARSGVDGKVRPYHSKLSSILDWLHTLPVVETELSVIREWTIKMLNNDQNQRPSARDIAEDPFLPPACRSCTLRPGPEQFEAIDTAGSRIPTPPPT